MTITRMRTLVAVADTGSVRTAADQLSVTESAVSAAIGALQRELGVDLVTRSGRGVALTTAGRRYAAYSRQILGLMDEAKAAASGEVDPASGVVRIAAVTTAGEHVLPLYLATFRERHPQARLDLEVSNRDHIWSLLADHRVDIAVGGRPPDDAAVVTRAIRPNELVVVAAPGFEASEDEATLTWLVREPGSGTRATTEAFLEQRGADPPRLTVGSNSAAIACSIAGLGVTLVSREAVARELADGELEVVPLRGTPLSRPWHAATHPTMTRTARLFLAHLCEPGPALTPFSEPVDPV